MKRIEVDQKTYLWFLLAWYGALAFSVGFTWAVIKLIHVFVP